MKIKALIAELSQTEHGFRHIMVAGDTLLTDASADHFNLALQLLDEESYQARMLATYLLGQLSASDAKAKPVLQSRVAADPDWRVQEMLAKAFDHYCSTVGYEKALPVIKAWLGDPEPNVKRAVTEGLRIWTSRPYFKAHPDIAIALLAAHKDDRSDYLRKSVGNALRDISRKFPELIHQETRTWDKQDPKIAFTLSLIRKNK